MYDERAELSKKDWLQIVAMPVFIVMLSALLVNFLGQRLQDRSFRQNALFGAKLDLIMSGQREAIDIIQVVDVAKRQIRANEDYIQRELRDAEEKLEYERDPQRREALRRDYNYARDYYCKQRSFMAASIATLKEAKIRLTSIVDFTSDFDRNKLVGDAVAGFTNDMESFLICLDNSDCQSCSEGREVIILSLRKVVGAHKSGDAIVEGV